MKNKIEYVLVYTTVAKKVDAEKIAKFLVEKRLSACTQIVGPITSIYHWKSKLEKSKEWMCINKTKKALYKKLEKALKGIHPYELPEIVATSIVAGSREYLGWIKKGI